MHLKCDARKLFEQAFQCVFGKRRGILREARLAHERYKSSRSLTKRARKAIVSFLSGFRGSGIPAPA